MRKRLNLDRKRTGERFVRAAKAPPSLPSQRRLYLSSALLDSLGRPDYVQFAVVGENEDQAAILPCIVNAKHAVKVVSKRYINSAVLWEELELQEGFRYPVTMKKTSGVPMAIIEVEKGEIVRDRL